MEIIFGIHFLIFSQQSFDFFFLLGYLFTYVAYSFIFKNHLSTGRLSFFHSSNMCKGHHLLIVTLLWFVLLKNKCRCMLYTPFGKILEVCPLGKIAYICLTERSIFLPSHPPFLHLLLLPCIYPASLPPPYLMYMLCSTKF